MTDRLFCRLRKRWLLATPEEKVRQSLIEHLVNTLGYPHAHIILEKGLEKIQGFNSIPQAFLPNRRIDLLIVAKNLHPQFALYPLLLIECKSIPLHPKALRQVMGYNHFLGACFIAMANQTESLLGWLDPLTKKMHASQSIPHYNTLYQHAQALLTEKIKI